VAATGGLTGGAVLQYVSLLPGRWPCLLILCLLPGSQDGHRREWLRYKMETGMSSFSPVVSSFVGLSSESVLLSKSSLSSRYKSSAVFPLWLPDDTSSAWDDGLPHSLPREGRENLSYNHEKSGP
jgi:hypothetical protein